MTLPDDVVQKIRAKETRAEQAKADRAEKKEHASDLSDEIRLEQLRKLGKSRSVEQQREFTRLYQKSRRRDQRGEESPFAQIEDAEDFWAANRLTLTKKKLDELLAQQELVLDEEHWMQHGFEVDPSDPDFVSLEEGLQDLDAFIATHLIHDEPQACQHHELRDFMPAWGLFAPKDTYDKVWGRVEAFYKNAEHFNALCSESRATEVFARFGIRIALGAFQVRMFKQRIAEHELAKRHVDVRRAHVEFESSQCWLCRAWESQQTREAEGQPPQVPEPPPPTIA